MVCISCTLCHGGILRCAVANCYADDADAQALDEYISQEEAMEMALRETMGSDGSGAPEYHQSVDPNHPSFNDEEYDDLFMAISDPAQEQVQASQDMDMS